jgi:hypothetical protein
MDVLYQNYFFFYRTGISLVILAMQCNVSIALVGLTKIPPSNILPLKLYFCFSKQNMAASQSMLDKRIPSITTFPVGVYSTLGFLAEISFTLLLYHPEGCLGCPEKRESSRN